MRYVRYTAYVCMFGRRGKGAEIPLMGVRFFEIAIPLHRPRQQSAPSTDRSLLAILETELTPGREHSQQLPGFIYVTEVELNYRTPNFRECVFLHASANGAAFCRLRDES